MVAERRGRRRAAIDDWTLLATYADRIALKTLTGRAAGREREQLRALWRARREGRP